MRKIKWIAEIGSNHNQDLNRCFELIKEAKMIGVDAVKFQLFKAEKLWKDKETIKKMKQWELPVSFIYDISQICAQFNIEFGCTPFYLNAVNILDDYVDFFKIGSYELLWLDLIKKCNETDTDLIISTGMANWKEIRQAINNINTLPAKISLLHCESSYPAMPKNCGLKAIKKLKEIYPNYTIGWSDHTVSPGVIHSAIHNGADIIEFHFDIDGKGNEYSIGHCWLPEEILSVKKDIKDGLATLQYSLDTDIENKRKQRTNPATGMRR